MALPEPDFAAMDEAPQEQEREPVVRFLQRAARHDNLALDMEEGERGRIAATVLEEYDLDKRSMDSWFSRMRDGLELATLLKEDRRLTGKGANIKFPLVTSAALQFNARAYPAIVPGSDPVLPKVYGDDGRGVKAARAQRVASHMSWQLTSEIREWEGETDALLVQLPIVGTMVRKVWHDPSQGRSRVKLCDAGSVIVNEKVRSIDAAPRVTEELMLYPYEIEERKRAGLFIDEDLGEHGAEQDKDAPQMLVEQHRRLDLDGDGYPEPYVVTVHKDSGKLLRIVANYGADDIRLDERSVAYDEAGNVVDGELLSIDRRDHFVFYHFLPSMDGGFWGTGLGVLLGDINRSINSIINILIDSAHRSSLGAGFIAAQNFRMKGGPVRFDFGEWKQVNALGSDLRAGLVPLQFPEPSAVMFQMLGLLIDAGREIASVKDVLTGEVSRQMTATATVALIEQGLAVFTAAYKRIYRALKEEFRMLARINAETLDDGRYAAFHDLVGEDGQPQQLSAAADYALDDMDIAPVADPRSVTRMQEMAVAQLLREMAAEGTVDPAAAAKRALEAAHVDDIEELVPEPDPIVAELAMRQAKHADAMMALERAKGEVEVRRMMAETEAELADVAKTYAEIDDMAARQVLERRKLMLEASQARMEGVLGLLKNDVDRRSAERVAGKPGDGGGGRVSR